ncbi:tRNA (adenosine(37)-N6)-threonylcarbamoyltransferase complex dimerization subunit type 1 TsaB [Pusillimonas sp.]|uniref:tRNA (adenosine(37)-N6)-threonylcarbamoyltransferase complex dimerization subunit type 1 TsaB n=1 Tax=Pusillimonas sp. TaxID=3040095 RepID=UPI0037C82F22
MGIDGQQLLALETSSSVCDVALLSSNAETVTVRSLSHDATGEHAERLLPMVDELLGQAGLRRTDLDAVAFGQGPGGFTGLRVACGVAQGIAFALDLPVIPVVSLHAAALRESGDEPIRVVAQDARMSEVYVAAYGKAADHPSGWHVLHEPVLLDIADLIPWAAGQARQWTRHNTPAVKLLGDALEAYPEVLREDALLQAAHVLQGDIILRRGGPWRASAESVARLAWPAFQAGRTVPPHLAAPLYVRDKVAYTTAEREQGRGGNPRARQAISIRGMTEADIEEAAAIENGVQAFPWTSGNFRDALQSGYAGWVACQEGRIQGFALMMFAPDVAHLLLIAVRPDAQRTGVGYGLLRHCESQAAARGLPALILEVRPSNVRALAFYRNRGFAQIGLRKDYYPAERNTREDALVMEKKLDGTEAGRG